MWYNLWLTNVVCTNWETIPGWFCLTSDLHHHIGPQIGRRVLNPMWPYSTLWMRIDLQVSPWIIGIYADLEKDASGTCGHFSEIRLFWGLFYPNIPYLLLRMEKEELKMENWGWITEIWGRRKENGRFRLQNWGWRAIYWWFSFKIWGFDHATPKFDTHVSVYLLSRITLFWGHCKILNFPLEDDLQLFPGLVYRYISLYGVRRGETYFLIHISRWQKT